jgi:hypothetical protein
MNEIREGRKVDNGPFIPEEDFKSWIQVGVNNMRPERYLTGYLDFIYWVEHLVRALVDHDQADGDKNPFSFYDFCQVVVCVQMSDDGTFQYVVDNILLDLDHFGAGVLDLEPFPLLTSLARRIKERLEAGSLNRK